LYSNVKEAILQNLRPAITNSKTSTEEGLLPLMNSQWIEHKLCMVMIRDILMYLDRAFVQKNKLMSVYDMGLSIFKKYVVKDTEIKDRLQAKLLSEIERERKGELIDREVIKGVLTMLVELGLKTKKVYEEDFEKEFLERSSLFYRTESLELIQNESCPAFLRQAERRLKEEKERVMNYLDLDTEDSLIKRVVEEYIRNHA
jgi:cullin 3